MNKSVVVCFLLIAVLCFGAVFPAQADNIYSKWSNGPPSDGSYFMIGVFLQQMKDLAAYKAIGVNTFVCIDGATNSLNLQTLKDNNMYCIASATEDEAWNHLSDKTFVAWRLPDEVDNYQHLYNIVKGKRFPTTGHYHSTSCAVSDSTCTEVRRLPTDQLLAMYDWIKQNDPSRPIHCCFGCGVADTDTPNRGGGWNDSYYVDYSNASDLVGYDVYPVHGHGEDYIWMQGFGLNRLAGWAGGRAMWNFFECQKPSGAVSELTAQDLKCEIWMSIIHGSMGIQYFCHEFSPVEDDNAFLKYTDLTDMAKIVNNQITQLAQVLNSTSVLNKITVSTSNAAVPIDFMVKEYNGVLYIFTCAGKTGTTKGTFFINGFTGSTIANVLGEGRTISVDGGSFSDDFAKWDAHVYAVPVGSSGGSGTNPLDTIRVYPNPMNLSLSNTKKVKFDTIMMPDVVIKIYTAEGNIIKSINEADFGNMGTAEWDLNDTSSISKGVYYFAAEDTAGHKKTGKIGINK